MTLPGTSTGRRVTLIGLGITVVILLVFIVRLDWREFISTFRTIRASWIFMVCAAIFVSVALRAVRWRVIATTPGSRLAVFWYATVLGYVGNMIYPARAGEAFRIVALCHSTRIPPGHVIASAFSDRLADVFIIGAAAFFVLGFQRLGPYRAEVLGASFLLSAVPILFVVAFVRWGGRFAPSVRRIAARLPETLAQRIPRWYGQAVEQTHVIRKPSVLTAALGLTVFAASIDYAAIWFAMKAMGWSLPPTAAVVVGILIAMGTMIPATPGYIGIYQVACVVGLKLYGLSEAAALAFSILLQITVLAVIGAQGAVALAHYGWRLGKLDEHVLAANGGSRAGEGPAP